MNVNDVASVYSFLHGTAHTYKSHHHRRHVDCPLYQYQRAGHCPNDRANRYRSSRKFYHVNGAETNDEMVESPLRVTAPELLRGFSVELPVVALAKAGQS